jgi:hypothetical protein
MHDIEMESHISAHMGTPSYFIPAKYGRSARIDMSFRSFEGYAVSPTKSPF